MAAVHDLIAQVAQLIRDRRTAGGAEQFVRLEINTQAAIGQVLLIGTAAQLDKLFDGVR